jgi:hypothetical protein
MPLVDILFSAFAAVLGTATVAVVMIRTSAPDADRPELPHFTIVATSSDAECTKTLRPEFKIKLPGRAEPISFSDSSMFGDATDTAPPSGLVNAWYFADTHRSQDSQLDKFCTLAGDCMRAELVVLAAKPGSFTVTPAVSQSTCQNVRLALRLGPLADDVSASDLSERNQVKSITFEVLP